MDSEAKETLRTITTRPATLPDRCARCGRAPARYMERVEIKRPPYVRFRPVCVDCGRIGRKGRG